MIMLTIIFFLCFFFYYFSFESFNFWLNNFNQDEKIGKSECKVGRGMGMFGREREKSHLRQHFSRFCSLMNALEN